MKGGLRELGRADRQRHRPRRVEAHPPPGERTSALPPGGRDRSTLLTMEVRGRMARRYMASCVLHCQRDP